MSLERKNDKHMIHICKAMYAKKVDTVGGKVIMKKESMDRGTATKV